MNEYHFDDFEDEEPRDWEQYVLDWPESPIPSEIPDAIRELAIPGQQLLSLLSGKEVWFWRREGLCQVMDFMESHNQAANGINEIHATSFAQFQLENGTILPTTEELGGFTSPGHMWAIRECFFENGARWNDDSVYWLHFETGINAADYRNQDTKPDPRPRQQSNLAILLGPFGFRFRKK